MSEILRAQALLEEAGGIAAEIEEGSATARHVANSLKPFGEFLRPL